MPRPCHCGNALPNSSRTPDQCPFCWMWFNSKSHRIVWGSGESLDPPRPDCVSLGLALLKQEPCGCAEKLRRCDLHESCTVAVIRPGFACCRTCGDYESVEVVEPREASEAKGVVEGIVDSVVRSLFLAEV